MRNTQVWAIADSSWIQSVALMTMPDDDKVTVSVHTHNSERNDVYYAMRRPLADLPMLTQALENNRQWGTSVGHLFSSLMRDPASNTEKRPLEILAA